ncbi:MAG TPA: hypothetical protein PLE48_13430 [Thiobacillus sp.]|uniref:hypothetical protein n=1 Tax=Acidovorax sp. TaxID=1872122 RepID=UPI002630C0C8|nr:hypothetical protein [Acidovorax sp.]HQT19122.1 hypothetical protein [Acidovorax defluvii]HQT71408.1 hypothetical protein [Thiobacillus sp.]
MSHASRFKHTPIWDEYSWEQMVYPGTTEELLAEGTTSEFWVGPEIQAKIIANKNKSLVQSKKDIEKCNAVKERAQANAQHVTPEQAKIRAELLAKQEEQNRIGEQKRAALREIVGKVFDIVSTEAARDTMLCGAVDIELNMAYSVTVKCRKGFVFLFADAGVSTERMNMSFDLTARAEDEAQVVLDELRKLIHKITKIN